MAVDTRETRRLSAAVFGNEKVVEVVLAIEDTRGPATAQDLARLTGISHSMVRDVLLRLSAAGLIVALPKIGGARSAQYYEVLRPEAWTLLVALARWVRSPTDRSDSPDDAHRSP